MVNAGLGSADESHGPIVRALAGHSELHQKKVQTMNSDVFEKAFGIAASLEQAGLPPGVQAVTVGYKRVQGVTTQQPALVFLVDRKRPLEGIHPAMAIPAEVAGFPTDVVELQAEPHDDTAGPYDHVEPLVGGVSIKADWKNGIGTLGALFCDRKTRQPMGLTNRHVVDNWSFNANGQAVFQPTESNKNRIGTVWQHNKAWGLCRNRDSSREPRHRSDAEFHWTSWSPHDDRPRAR